jgi:imidazolonepropionase-like amidohydrolase
VVLGSLPNGLPPGLALHAEMRALEAAGLSAVQVLKAAGLNASTALGLNGQIGTIVPGALADFVLVTGDPLGQPADAINIVAVVRNGRFYSLGGLLERATAGSGVE